MADDSDFSLISFDADDEDDVVIHAGAGSAHAQPRREPASDSPARSAAVDDHPDKIADSAEHAVLHDEGIDPEARAEYMRHLAHKKAREESRLITTEEDLHARVPFARMQRVLMAIALILLVAFAVYWFCFHPLG